MAASPRTGRLNDGQIGGDHVRDAEVRAVRGAVTGPTLVQSIAATTARVEEHGGDAVEALHASGVALGHPDADSIGELHARTSRQILRIGTYGELYAQAFAAGVITGRHYEREARAD